MATVPIGSQVSSRSRTWRTTSRQNMVLETQAEPTTAGMLGAAGASIAEEASVGPRAVVSAGCRIEAGAEVGDSVLLEGCTVGRDALVEGSILAPGAEVEAGAALRNAVVGRDERVTV